MKSLGPGMLVGKFVKIWPTTFQNIAPLTYNLNTSYPIALFTPSDAHNNFIYVFGSLSFILKIDTLILTISDKNAHHKNFIVVHVAMMIID